ncbi:MAG: hypothetical protein COA94_02045 [Rickettsiales bacterium]|nr:MAG: hypothetical protein COA94_02045 [Rickettsiales bacterium]
MEFVQSKYHNLSVNVAEGLGASSSDYVVTNDVLTILCKNGHEFEMTPSNVKSGHWCPKCLATRAEEKLKAVILERGGILLSDYVRNYDRVTIQCENNHEFRMTPNSVKSGRWCPKCSGWCPIQAEERLKAVILERGGILLSDYVKNKEKVTIQCENGHKIEMTPNNVRCGQWCPKCSGWCREYPNNCPIQAEKRLKTVILERGGTLLSDCIRNNDMVTIQCEKGHEFEMTPSSVKRGYWCPKCSGKCPIQAEERLKTVILERGGILLSDYVKNKEKVTIQCENNHKFEATPSNVKSGYWCPKCSATRAEEKLKAVILERGGILLSNYVSIHKKLTIQCENGHKFVMTPSTVESGCWCYGCLGDSRTQNEEKLEAVILERGGTLLSDYFRIHDMVTIQCKNGHKFKMTPHRVKCGYWCPKCSDNCYTQSEKKFKAMILERGGTLLSDHVGIHRNVNIQCENGHMFKMHPYGVKSGRWCSECQNPKQ